MWLDLFALEQKGTGMEHKGTVTLETQRLVLRRYTKKDAGLMFCNWASDPEVTKFLTWQPHESVEVSKNVIDSWILSYEEPQNYVWAIELKEIGEPIGSISAVRVDDRTEAVSIGYCIGKRWWGRAVTAEALRAVIAFFFQEVGMNCVSASHDPRNPNSGKVMRKCGMHYEGTWRAGGVNNQGICDESWYSILKSEYDKQESAKQQVPDCAQDRSLDPVWEKMYQKASAVQHGRKISDYIEVGGVAAAILSTSGRIYTGVCVDTSSTLGICAERNAIFHMLTEGEQEIQKVLAVMPDGHIVPPCGACRELMVQLMPHTYKQVEIMLEDTAKNVRRIVTLGDLTPEWWI